MTDCVTTTTAQKITRCLLRRVNSGLETLDSGCDNCAKFFERYGVTRGVAKSQAEATFYRFAHTYLVYVKGYPSNIKYILIQLHSTLSIQAIIPLNRSAGSWEDDFPIQRMRVLALNY